jgi:hypothetical protein
MQFSRVKGKRVDLIIMIELSKVPETSSHYMKDEPHHFCYHYHIGSRNSTCS